MTFQALRTLILVAIAISTIATTAKAGQERVPITDGVGNQLYMIVLDERLARDEDALDELPARRTRDPLNAIDIYGWHKPSVRALVKRFERTYSLRAVAMTSYTIPSFSAAVSSGVLESMRVEPAFARAIPLYYGDSSYSSWSDIPGSETIPWGKIAIGTNDGGSTSNRIYMIDGAVPSPATHVDLSYWVAPVNVGYFYAGDHGSHVAGILSAAANNVAVRGINPAASDLVVVYRGDTPSDIATAFDWVLADAEQDQVYAVLNYSSNGWLYSEYNTNNINSVLRRVSTRVLLVQAAGNQHQDACNEAQGGGGRTNSADGILVVGGIDESGAEAIPFDNTSVWPGVWEPGSNYGPCVEVWAPSLHVKSTWNTSSTAVVSLSGTSMAAPHVVALAARYGSNATTPVERERWIHGKTFWTGSYSLSGQPILVPSYTQTLTTNVGSRLFPVSSSADATLPGTSTGYLSDGLYLTNTWNAGHYAPGWVEFDLGSSRVITAIRAVPEQYPAGSVVHHVYAGNSPGPTAWVATLSGLAAMMEPLATTVGTYARYVRIYTSSSPSFVAWREVEIYGY